jgi:hypothetical protein
MLPFDDVLQRLKDILSTEKGEGKVFDKDVAEALGIDAAYFAVLKKRERIPLEAVADFCARRKISINWLLYDQLPRSLEEETEKYASVRYFRSIHASAGGGAHNEETVAERLLLDPGIVEALGGFARLKHIDAIRVIGDSMEPLLESGTTIFVDRSQKEVEAGGVFVVRTPGGVYVKRLLPEGGEGIVLLSDNPLYPPESLTVEELEIVGRVVGRLEKEEVRP